MHRRHPLVAAIVTAITAAGVIATMSSGILATDSTPAEAVSVTTHAPSSVAPVVVPTANEASGGNLSPVAKNATPVVQSSPKEAVKASRPVANLPVPVKKAVESTAKVVRENVSSVASTPRVIAPAASSDQPTEPTQAEIDEYLRGQAELDAVSAQREADYDREMAASDAPLTDEEIDEYLRGQAELDTETAEREAQYDREMAAQPTEPTQAEIDEYLRGQAELDAVSAQWEADYDKAMEAEEAAKQAAFELEAELTKEALELDAQREAAKK